MPDELHIDTINKVIRVVRIQTHSDTDAMRNLLWIAASGFMTYAYIYK